MIYIKSLVQKDHAASGEYPYCTDVIRNYSTLEFDNPVTMLCGENGSGKSTLLEIAAEACRANRVNGVREITPKTKQLKEAARDFTAVMSASRPKSKLLFTSESFTRYIDFLYETKREAEREIANAKATYKSRFAIDQASSPYANTIYEIDGMYKASLDEQSHGQGFIDFFSSRIFGGGLFFLDEPEGALAYDNQLALMYIIRENAARGAQFVIATHSPILLAYPDASIYEIVDGELVPKKYDGITSIAFLKRFVARHDDFFSDGAEDED